MTTAEDENDNAEALCKALERLSDALREHPVKGKFNEVHGVGAPPLDCVDLAITAEAIAGRIASVDWTTAEDMDRYFSDLTGKVTIAIDQHLPQIQSNSTIGFSLAALLYSLNEQLAGKVTAQVIDKSLHLPVELRRNVGKAQSRLKAATAIIDDVDGKLEVINAAHQAALNLPATQADLEQAVKDIEESRASALRHESDAKRFVENFGEIKAQLEQLQTNATETMARVDEAYRASTSDGLARSFKEKAVALNKSMYLWAVGLVVALGAAICLGIVRFPLIMAAVNPQGSAVNWGVVALQGLVSILSLGPAVWLAWVSTKQIGQRFRLSEDYAYKAALSAAYEGYRSEAINIDPLMQAQLFSIALTRLDEIPLRLVDQNVPGSPVHELISSSEFKEALIKVPGLKDRVISLFTKKQKLTPDGESTDAKSSG